MQLSRTRSILCMALVFPACGGSDKGGEEASAAGTSSSSGAEETGGSTTGAAAGPTYYQDVAPVLSERCSGCHQAGGAAPFALTSYAESAPFAALIGASVAAGEMPPWPPGGDSPALRHDRSLTEDEVALLGAWVEAGAPEGDKATAAELRLPEVIELPSVDLKTDIGTDHVPDDSLSDDYHCFMIDLGVAEDRVATGYHFIPGNGKVVHHVLSSLFTADSRAAIEAMDAATPEVGWPCFGGYSNIPGATLLGALGGWVPGVTAVNYPAGTGAEVPAGSLLVAQIHYNLAGGTDPDRTRLEVAFAAKDQQAGLQLLQSSPFPWAGFKIPAGAKDVVAEQEMSARVTKKAFPDGEAYIVGVAGHMHLLGTGFSLTRVGAGGEETILEIPRWDFHWQGSYELVTPMKVVTGDQVRIRCVYDNTAEHRAAQGMGPPVDVTWGEGTEDEMCLAYLQMIDNLP